MPGLLKTAAKNQVHQTSGARYFELRPVYLPEGEYLTLGVLAVGDALSTNWQNLIQITSYYEMKGLFESLASLGSLKARYTSTESDAPFLHPGQSSRILLGAESAGLMGLLHPKITAHYDLIQPATYMELSIQTAAKYWNPKVRVQSEFSDQPTVSRDLALVVPTDLTFGSLESSILKKKINQLKSINLFDIYAGDKLKPGTKSMALNLIYGDDKKTLTDQEVNDIHFQLVKQLEQELGVVLR